jgi:UDP-2,3-diacylglucosamine pyrophosphatase LpxH
MGQLAHQVFVISDLHLGGRAGEQGARGFQMMTHPDRLASFIDAIGRPGPGTKELIIAGDFVDFLAQETETPGVWTPIIEDPRRAAAQLEQLARSSSFAPVFEALGAFLARKHKLTIMLGNHDIELSFPQVRSALARVLRKEPGHDFTFIYDGEAYTLGDALIEHGNRYDRYNIVDHDKLRRLRSLQSRGQEQERDGVFPPPAGSRLVAEVMNPIKSKYAFVDLLKPENESVIPILLALEPDFIEKIEQVARVLAPSITHGLKEDDLPVRLSEASANAGAGAPDAEEPLASALKSSMGENEARRFLAEIDEARRGEDSGVTLADASAFSAIRQGAQQLASLWRITEAGLDGPLESRLPALRKALRALQGDRTFERTHETEPRYLDAAKALCARGRFRYVVFGHTHLARELPHEHGVYLNSGTWADLMRVPKAVLSEDDAVATQALRRFVKDITENRLSEYVAFMPTYAQLDMDANGRVLEGHVRDDVPR